MVSEIFVLMMVWSTSSSQGGVFVVSQEFNSQANCVSALNILIKAQSDNGAAILRTQGCFKK